MTVLYWMLSEEKAKLNYGKSLQLVLHNKTNLFQVACARNITMVRV